jgi:hypothetical protein
MVNDSELLEALLAHCLLKAFEGLGNGGVGAVLGYYALVIVFVLLHLDSSPHG